MITPYEISTHDTLEAADFALRTSGYWTLRTWAWGVFNRAGLLGYRRGIEGLEDVVRATLRIARPFLTLLFLSLPLAAADAPKAPRLKPISTVTVKVVSAEHYAKDATKAQARTLWRITTADSDSCTAWVSTKAPNLKALKLEAFAACQEAIDRAVDAEHAMAERSKP